MNDVLVTGGAGFIGSNTVDELIKKGYSVAIADNLSTGNKKNLNPQADFYEVDIASNELEKVFEKTKPNYVVHLAAQIDVRKSIKDPVYDARSNILGSINLFNFCDKYGVEKVVYSSSGGAIYGEPKNDPVDETHTVKPLCPYGASKYAVEKYLPLYKFDFNIMRYANVYGPRQDPLGEAGVVAIFSKKICGGESPVIFGDGLQSRDFVYVEDVARANISGLELETDSKAFNVGTGVETTVFSLYEFLREIFNSTIEPTYADPVAGEVRRIRLNCDLAKKELGWMPSYSIREGLEKTVLWMKNE